MQWSSPDTVIPDLYQPNDWNRYSYARNNPLKYSDPSGHWPDYWDYLMGATYQFVNDMTMGLYQDFANSQNVCVDCNASDSFEAGQQGGRYASSLVAAAEVVDGTVAVLDGLTAMGGTAAGGATCTVVTAGACAAIAVPALAVEGVIVVAGSAAVVHGGATLAYIKRNQVQGGGGFFKSAGIDTTNHFWDRLKENGFSEKQAFNTYNNGKKFTNQDGQYIRWDSKTGLTLIIDADDGRVINTMFNPKPMKNWELGWEMP